MFFRLSSSNFGEIIGEVEHIQRERAEMMHRQMQMAIETINNEFRLEVERQKSRIREEIERINRERHQRNVNNANKALKGIENELMNMFMALKSKLVRGDIEKINDKYKLFNVNSVIPHEKISEFIEDEIEEKYKDLLKKAIVNSNHFNVIVIGKTGVGKSTLINSILNLSDKDKAPEGFGSSTTKSFTEYISDNVPGLRLIDSRGIEIGNFGAKNFIEDVTEYIENLAGEGDSDKFIHCIWYCIQSSSSRVEEEEEAAIKEIKSLYEGKNLPVIFVLTKNINDNDSEKMEKYLKKIGAKSIVPVLAKDYTFKSSKFVSVIKANNMEKLLNLSFEKCRETGFASFKKSISHQIFDDIILEAKMNNCDNLLDVMYFTRSKCYDNSQFPKRIKNIIYRQICLEEDDEISSLVNNAFKIFMDNYYKNKEIAELTNTIVNKAWNNLSSVYIKCRKILMDQLNVSESELVYNYSLEGQIKTAKRNEIFNTIMRLLGNKISMKINDALLVSLINAVKKREKEPLNVDFGCEISEKIREVSNKIYSNYLKKKK